MSEEFEVSTLAQPVRIKGVSETSWGGRWFAHIRRAGRLHYLGTYPTPEDAAEAYRQAEELLDG